MANPNYEHLGKIDLLLGVDVFIVAILFGRRVRPPNTPVTLETEFGWVLAGRTTSPCRVFLTSPLITRLLSGDELLRQFWEMEESPGRDVVYKTEEQSVTQHFQGNHFRRQWEIHSSSSPKA